MMMITWLCLCVVLGRQSHQANKGGQDHAHTDHYPLLGADSRPHF